MGNVLAPGVLTLTVAHHGPIGATAMPKRIGDLMRGLFDDRLADLILSMHWEPEA